MEGGVQIHGLDKQKRRGIASELILICLFEPTSGSQIQLQPAHQVLGVQHKIAGCDNLLSRQGRSTHKYRELIWVNLSNMHIQKRIREIIVQEMNREACSTHSLRRSTGLHTANARVPTESCNDFDQNTQKVQQIDIVKEISCSRSSRETEKHSTQALMQLNPDDGLASQVIQESGAIH